jgi:predicted PhzF superfamily epimerase YddE/YHI9
VVRAFVVDAFTQTMFRGSPAGLVLLDRPGDPGWMQAVATEFNHPATAFVEPTSDRTAARGLRWFSPVAELTLCGHATLASAHILGGDQAFQTGSGELTCSAEANGAISMRFPADPVRPESPTSALVAALSGITLHSVWRGRTDLLVAAESAAEVRALQPNHVALANVAARAVIVTAAGDGTTDIVSRVFAPSLGIPEDPVTGSAHCTLASYWSERLGITELHAEQASSRGGLLHMNCDGDHVVISGHAVTVYSGELHTQTADST